MQKISGIIAASPRVTSTDLTSAKAVRPGVPSFGAPVGSSAFGESARLPVSAVDRVRQMQAQQLSEAQAKEKSHVELVEQMANNFFMNQRKEVGLQLAPVSEGIATVQDSDLEADVFAPPHPEANADAHPGDSLIKGGYLDVVA